MNPKLKNLSLVLLFLQLFLPARTVLADTGPKPSMEFKFSQELSGGPVTISSGILFECQQSDCSDAEPLQEVGPQGLYCRAQSCSAVAYGFAPYHRLEVTFSDGKTRTSNVFETAGFESQYHVTIRPEDLLVEALFSPWVLPPGLMLVILCACLLCGGLLVAALVVFLQFRHSSKK